MKRVEAKVFADSFKEIEAESLKDYQQRQVPELTDDQVGRVWSFSTDEDLNAFKRLLGQWGSASNLCAFVLSDETGITTLGGGLFGGMLYSTDDDGDAVPGYGYETPEHDSTYVSRDGSSWSANVLFEERIVGDDKFVDLVINLTETYEAATKEWRIVASSVATLNADEDVSVGTNVTITAKVEATAYYNEVEVGAVSFIPIYGEAICDVPERYEIQSIEEPYVDHEILDGMYRSSGIFSIKRRKEGSRSPDDVRHHVIQIIRRKYIAASDYTKVGTNWEIMNGREYRSGSKRPILRLRNLDPSVARSIASDISSSQTTYTNEIHTVTDGLLEGTWYSLHADYNIEDDGSGTVLWFLSLHNNDDFYTSVYVDYDASEIQFFKVNATSSSKEDLLDNYYFTPGLDWYYREGDAGNATKKNGEDVDVALPANANNLRTAVDGRVVRIDPRYSEDRDDWFIQVRIVFFTTARYGFSVYRSSKHEVRTEVSCILPTKQDSVDLQAQSYFDSIGNWYVSEDGSAIDLKNGVAYGGADTIADVEAVKVTADVVGRQARVKEEYEPRSQRWFLSFVVMYTDADKRMSTSLGGTSCIFASSPMTTTKQEKGYRVSEEDLRNAIADYTSCPEGTLHNITYADAGNGQYNFEAIKVTTEGFATTFVAGGVTTYFGHHYKKKPTSDVTAGGGGWALNGDNYENDDYLLIGGYDAGGGDIQSIVDDTQNVSPNYKLEDDKTWSWNIRIENVEDESYGDDDFGDPSNWLFRYGYDLDEWRWIGRRLRENLIVGGTIDVRGRFIDIPAGEFGNHGQLSGRRVVIRELRNQDIQDGKTSYDVYERVVTAEIEDDDGWFMAGVVEATDREKRVLSSLATLKVSGGEPYTNFDSASGYERNIPNSEEGSGSGSTFHAYENAVMRRKTVQVHRKFFVRRPTKRDLETSMNAGSVSIYEAMEMIANPTLDANPLEIVTFNVLQVSMFKYRVERRTLRVSPDWVIDLDAFSKFTIDGESACRMTRVDAADISDIDA